MPKISIIRIFDEGDVFAVGEADSGLMDFLRERGLKPTTTTDALGTRIATGVGDITNLETLLNDFYGKNSGVILRVFSKNQSREYRDIKLQ